MTKRARFVWALMAAAALMAATGPAPQEGGSWNQWRGPGRDAIGSPYDLPAELPAELRRVWQVGVGEGHSSPLVEAGRIYLHSREGGQEVARAVSLADGSTIWRQSYDAPYTMNPAARSHGPGPKSTPVLAGGRLFTFGITEVLSAWDAGTGELLWQEEFSGRYPETAPIYGTAMSPIVVDDVVVAHVGWDDGGALTAFDVASGEVRWATEELPPAYASPILVEIGGTRQLVTQSEELIIGVDAATGELLWSIPFVTPVRQNSVTAVAHGERLILSGLQMDLFAVEPRREDSGEWTAEEVWRNDRLPTYMSSPVLVGNRLFGMSHMRAGQFFCIDADTGEPIWTSHGREGENAAIIALGDRVAFLTDEARLVIVAAGVDAYEPLAEYEVADSPTWAHPIFLPGGVLVKDLDTLAYWSF